MEMVFEELDYQRTALGELVLRRRTEPRLGVVVTEVKLGDEFLMSSLFTASEIALADLALARLPAGPVEVAVGGLGLGHTAQAALAHPAVASLLVVELLAPVIRWHREGLVPLGAALCGDPRCTLQQGDFFERAAGAGLDERDPGRRFDAVLVDIDHSPRHALGDASRSFYGAEGLGQLRRHLKPGGVFGLWSNDPPDAALEAALAAAFPRHETHVVRFDNPLQRREATATIHLAFAPG